MPEQICRDSDNPVPKQWFRSGDPFLAAVGSPGAFGSRADRCRGFSIDLLEPVFQLGQTDVVRLRQRFEAGPLVRILEHMILHMLDLFRQYFGQVPVVFLENRLLVLHVIEQLQQFQTQEGQLGPGQAPYSSR